MDQREQALTNWLSRILAIENPEFRPASSDASFRRYFRLRHRGRSLIVMDAPPDREPCEAFIDICTRLRDAGLNTPQILEQDPRQGFLLLSDLGDQVYLDVLETGNADRLYGDALGALAAMQGGVRTDGLPDYDADLLHTEMALFPDWLLDRHLGLSLTTAERRVLTDTFEQLGASALQQPRTFVHRDYHSRNLTPGNGHTPGILDFQDAVRGPITYDLVSLLRDCYITWPLDRVTGWALGYRRLALQTGLLEDVEEAQFLRWFDWMGLQRHLKASGIFARLCHRDGKDGYLPDVPRTVAYLVDISARYPELQPFHALLTGRVWPALERQPAA